MADKRITELNNVTLPLNGSELLPIVQNGETKNVAASDLTKNPPIANTYANVTALLADQANQQEGYLYGITDATGFGDITQGRATVSYKGTTNGDETDYNIEWRDDLSNNYNYISEMLNDTSLSENSKALVYNYENNKLANINATYIIKSSAQANTDGDIVDGYGLGFNLINGLVAVLEESNKITNAHFGIYPDGVTNWELLDFSRFRAMLKASINRLLTVRKGLYFTALNTVNLLSGMRIHFEDAEFAGVFHLISSGSILEATEITSMTQNAGVVTITFDSAHGMTSQRYLDFFNTNTDLDQGKYLCTILNTTQITIESNGDISGFQLGGYSKDSPLDDIIFTGTVSTYTRFGTINLTNFHFDTLIQKSDTSKNLFGDLGSGMHAFFGCKNWYGKNIIALDTDVQNVGSNIHAAVAFDGNFVENINIDNIYVKDSGASGVIMQALNFNIKSIVIDGYGRGSIFQAPVNYTTTDIHGKSTTKMACGAWFILSSGNVDSIRIKNRDSNNNYLNFTDRNDVYADVCISRTNIVYDGLLQNNVESKSTVNISHILLDNVLNMGVAGSNDFPNATIGSVDVLRVAPDNPMITSATERGKYGLIFHSQGRMKIGSANFTDVDYATAVRSYYGSNVQSYLELRNFYCKTHKSTLIVLGNNYAVENVYVDSRSAGDDGFAIICENNSSTSARSHLKNVKLLNLGLVPCKGIDFQTDYSVLEGFYLFRYGSNGGATLRFSGDTSTVRNGYMLGNNNAAANTADGLNCDGNDRASIKDVRVTGFQGTGVKGSGTNLRAEGCVSVSNGTDSSISQSNFVTNSQSGNGNFNWMV